MEDLTFEKLRAKEVKDRPRAFENEPFPYNQISDSRRFEELVYSLYKIKIEHREFNVFDDIVLMTGVRESGRDCVLYVKGNPYGLIQCKQYQNNLSKNLLGEEITRFALYALANPSLIFDKEDFTYFVCVAKGFDNKCNEFIDGFNHLIGKESMLDRWITKSLKQPTLKHLSSDGNLKNETLNIGGRKSY